MTIKITRKTGIGSGITPVKIRIENEEIVKLTIISLIFLCLRWRKQRFA